MKKIDFNGPAHRKRAVMWHVAGGWISNGVFIIQGLVLIPLYIHFLGDRLYGFWLATGGVLNWLSMVDVGASAVTQQRCAAAFGRGAHRDVVRYFWHGAVVMGAVLILFFAALVAVSGVLPGLLGIDAVYRDLITACFMVTGLAVLGRLSNDFMRYFAAGLQRNQVPVFAQTFGDLAGLVGILVALVYLRMGLWAIVTGAVLRAAIPFCINITHTAWILYSFGERISWSRSVFADYCRTTPAVLAAKSTGTLARNLPAVVITRLLGPEATVAFTVTLRVVQIVQNFINQALSGLFAACAHYFHDPDVAESRRERTLRDLARGYFVASGAGVALYALFNQGFVTLWTSEAQFAGAVFTVVAALASFVNVRDNLLVGLGVSLGEISRVELLRAGENLLHAGLIVVGIYQLGLVGAPLAMLTAGLVAQFGYFALFREKRPAAAAALGSLRWLWAPVAGVLLLLFPARHWFVVDSWFWFVVLCGLASLPFGVAVYFGLPGLKEKVGGKLRGFRRFARFAPFFEFRNNG